MNSKGIALVLVLFFMLILLTLSVAISQMITLNIKGTTAQNEEFIQFQGADGGIYAVAGWMYYYKRADVPKEVTHTDSYSVEPHKLAETVRNPPGYSLVWKGFDARLDSISKTTEVEAIVFVPTTPVGYGNE